MDIRPYTLADRTACLSVFDSLTLPTGRDAFADYLAQPPAAFFVAEHDGTVIGCGGFTNSGNTAELVWGMVSKPWQRQGLGRFLLFYRLREIGRLGSVEMVHLHAPVATAGFYSKQGFRETGPASSEAVEMSKRLAVCT